MTTYAAHIVTVEAHALGDPEVIVMTQADETGAADSIANYPLKAGDDPIDVLVSNGWRSITGGTEVEPGYTIVDVEAVSEDTTIIRVISTIRTLTSLDSWGPIEIINEWIVLTDADPAEGVETYLREQGHPADHYRLEWDEVDGPGRVEVEGYWDGETLTIDEARGIDCDD